MVARKRDVELVVRAKDAASKTVDAVTDALRDLSTEQNKLTDSAAKSDSALDRLGSAFKNLNSELRGLNVVDKLERELTKADGAIKRISASIAESVQENERLAISIGKAEREYEQLSEAALRAQAAVEKERAAKAAYRTEQTRANAELRKAVTERNKLAAAETRLGASITKQNGVLREAVARYERLKQEIAETDTPTKRLQQTFERSGTAVDRARAKLEGLENTLSETRASSAAAATNFERIENAAQEAAAGFEQQSSALAEAEVRYKELGAQAKTAGTQLNSLRADSEKVEASLEEQNNALAKARTEYRQFGAAIERAEGSMRQLQGSTAEALEQEFREQAQAVAATRQEYDEAANSALRLGQRLSQLESEAAGSIFNQRAAQDVAKLTQEYEEQRIVLSRSKAELQEQETALRELGQISQATGGDVSELTERTRRFADVQERTARSLAQIRTASDRQLDSLRRQGTEAERAARGQRELGNRVRETGDGMGRQRGQVSFLAQAYRRLYGESRQSLSIQQRLRGEVLALVTAYTGLFGLIEGIRGVSRAVQELEQAQLKFNIAFDDQGEADAQLQFARNLAKELALNIGIVTDRYAALQIAAKGTNLSVRDTEELFIGLSQASRALNLTTEQQNRVFTAVQQIVQKGVVSMEELRQQLGESLPGAMRIFAEAAGFGVDEIDEFQKAVAQGAVSADILANVGKIFQRQFGPAAAEAQDKLAAAQGRFNNAFREFRELLGDRGVTEGLKNLFESLANTLSDPAFTEFASRLAAGIGNLLTLLGRLAENFQAVVRIISVLIGLKLATVFTPLALGAIGAARNLSVLITGMRGTAAATGGLRVAFIGLTAAIRTAFISTGIGAIIVGLTVLFGNWLTSVDQTTESLNTANAALDAHSEVMGRVQEAYDAANGSVSEFQTNLKEIGELTAVEAARNLDKVRDSILETVEAFDQVVADGGGTAAGRFFGVEVFNGASREFRNAVRGVIQQTQRGEIAFEDLRDELDAVSIRYREGSESNRRFADAIDEVLEPLEDQIEAFGEAEAIVKALTGTEEEAADAAEALGLAQEKAADQAEAALLRQQEGAEKVRDALAQMAGTIPQFGRSLEELKQINALEKIYQDAVRLAATMGEVLALTQGFNDAVANINVGQAFDSISGSTDGVDAAASLIRDFEGFRSTPYFDVNALRAGFGSDTITLSDGTVRAVTEGVSVSVEDANRDLLRRITQEFQPIASRAVGSQVFGNLAPQQQAVLTSIAYNYGRIPEAVASAVREGRSDEEVAEAIRGLSRVTDRSADLDENEKAALRTRRAQEANIFARSGTDSGVVSNLAREQVRRDEQAARAAQRRADEQERFLSGQRASITQQEFENGLVNQNVIDREVAKAIREAEIEAQKVGLELTEAQRESIRAVTTEKFRQQAADDASAAAAERTADAEARVNNLVTQRTELERQLEIFRNNGNTEAAASAEEQIKGINEQLLSAIDNAIAMWQAIGGGEADAAIARLRSAKLEAQGLDEEGNKNKVTWRQVGEVFGGGVVSAFDNFARSVAEGQSIGEAARNAFLQFASDFLRQIAQMIIQQALLNALSGVQGGGGFLGGVFAGIAHTGGVVGNNFTGSNSGRRVNPGVFAGAPRFHEGGLPGLRPNEVATILKRGEEVVTEDDPRHARNGGGMAGASRAANVKVVNTFDAADMLDVGLQDARGQEVILNFLRSNPDAVRAAIG